MENLSRKVAALLTSVLMAASCGIAEPISTFVTSVSAASTGAVATQMYIYDENGKDISDNPVVYLDTSDCAGGPTSTTLTVKIGNGTGNDNTDSLRPSIEVYKPPRIECSTAQVDSHTWKIHIDGLYAVKPYGITNISLTTGNGEVYRQVTVYTYTPAIDASIKFSPAENTYGAIDLLEKPTGKKNYVNIGGTQVIANHKYIFKETFYSMPGYGQCTDTAQWDVFDGEYYGEGTPKPTDKAEVTQDGLFTPKKSGTVTLRLKAKATETSDRSMAYTMINKIGEDGKTEIDPATGKPVQEKVLHLPKYIRVTIVKENPAKAMKIVNAPKYMESNGDNKTLQLELQKTPTYNSEQGYATEATDYIRWESSNKSVATVDENGIVTAKGKGEVTITAYAENPTVTASCTFRVMTKATSLSFVTDQASTRIGVPLDVSVKMSPDAADDHITWTSSDPSVATVTAKDNDSYNNTQTAVINGKKKGTVVITATAENSGVQVKRTFNINDRISTKDIALSYTDGNEKVDVNEGSTVQIYAGTGCKNIKIDGIMTSTAGDNPDDKINWTISGNTDSNGQAKYLTYTKDTKSITFHGFAQGANLEKVKVTAASDANPELTKTFYVQVLKSCDTVTIKEAVTGRKARSLVPGEISQLETDLTINDKNYPYKHSDTIKSWTSSNTAVATVNNNGLVTAKSNGTATIEATTASGKSKTYTITVFTASAITLTGTKPNNGNTPYIDVNLDKNSTGKSNVTYTVYNQDSKTVSNVNVSCTSSNPSVAEVENKDNGTKAITCKNVGTARITITCGAQKAEYDINVYAKSDSFTVDKIEDVVYSPTKAAQPKPVVKLADKVLNEGTDYTLTYENNTKVGTAARVIITFKGNYIGAKTVMFKIVAKQLTDSDIKKPVIAKQAATGAQVTPEINLYHNGVKLVKGTDYTVSYSNNVKPGTASATVTGKGNYTGKTVLNFNIYCNHINKKLVRTITEPTCKSKGRAVYSCPDCKQNNFELDVPMLSHNWKPIEVVAPTSTTNGYVLYKCSRCGETKRDDYTSTLNVSKVTGLKASSTNNSVKLTWNKASGANGYAIYKYNSSTKKYTRVIKVANSTSYTIKNLSSLTTYKFIVRGYKNYNGSEVLGPQSNAISVQTKLSAPSKVKVSSSTSSAVKLSWTKNSKASGYLVYKYDSAKKKWVQVAKTSSLTKTVSKLKSGTTYKFGVKAYRISGGKTYYSGLKTVATSTKPAAVKFSVSAGSKKATVKWSKVTGATNYTVYYKTSANGSFKKLTTTTKTSFTKTGLTRGKKYYFTVKANRRYNGKVYVSEKYTTKAVKVK